MRTLLHTESSLGRGGQEIRTLAETRWLISHGWNALIACQPDSLLLREARAASVPVESIRMRGAADVGALFRLRRLIRERGVSLVHTHSSIDSWLGGIAAKSLGRPVVRSRHVSIPIPHALVYRLARPALPSRRPGRPARIAAGLPPRENLPASARGHTQQVHP